MKQTAYYLENITLSCYLPHLSDWPFESGDKINWHYRDEDFTTIVFSIHFVSLFNHNNWKESSSDKRFEPISFSHEKTDQPTITIAHAAKSYSGQYWCEAEGRKKPIPSKNIALDISST